LTKDRRTLPRPREMKLCASANSARPCAGPIQSSPACLAPRHRLGHANYSAPNGTRTTSLSVDEIVTGRASKFNGVPQTFGERHNAFSRKHLEASKSNRFQHTPESGSGAGGRWFKSSRFDHSSKGLSPPSLPRAERRTNQTKQQELKFKVRGTHRICAGDVTNVLCDILCSGFDPAVSRPNGRRSHLRVELRGSFAEHGKSRSLAALRDDSAGAESNELVSSKGGAAGG
jgi:hypothetical protein